MDMYKAFYSLGSRVNMITRAEDYPDGDITGKILGLENLKS